MLRSGINFVRRSESSSAKVLRRLLRPCVHFYWSVYGYFLWRYRRDVKTRDLSRDERRILRTLVLNYGGAFALSCIRSNPGPVGMFRDGDETLLRGLKLRGHVTSWPNPYDGDEEVAVTRLGRMALTLRSDEQSVGI